MSKKRINNDQRLRRELELLRAQVDLPRAQATDKKPTVSVDSSMFNLPIKAIKGDLFRTILFTTVAVVAIVLLGRLNILETYFR